MSSRRNNRYPSVEPSCRASANGHGLYGCIVSSRPGLNSMTSTLFACSASQPLRVLNDTMMLEEKGNMRLVLLTVWYLSDQSMVLE